MIGGCLGFSGGVISYIWLGTQVRFPDFLVREVMGISLELGIIQAILWYLLSQWFSYRWWFRSMTVGLIAAVAPTFVCPMPLFFGVAPLVFIVQGCVTGLLVDRIFPRDWPSGACQTCGYDLTGNVSGKCPECGATTSD